jgi:hypothetical protein
MFWFIEAVITIAFVIMFSFRKKCPAERAARRKNRDGRKQELRLAACVSYPWNYITDCTARQWKNATKEDR